MFKTLIRKRLNKLNDFSSETKIALGIDQYPIEILYGEQASAYAKQNGIKLNDGFFDYVGKEQPLILIKNPLGIFVKSVIRHELTHYKQFIEKRLIPVRFKEKEKYYKNESEIEAYKEGANAYKNNFILKTLYHFNYHGNKFIHLNPKTTLLMIAFYVLAVIGIVEVI